MSKEDLIQKLLISIQASSMISTQKQLIEWIGLTNSVRKMAMFTQSYRIVKGVTLTYLPVSLNWNKMLLVIDSTVEGRQLS